METSFSVQIQGGCCVPDMFPLLCFQAVFHEEQRCMLRAWLRWKRRTQQQVREAEKQEASQVLHAHRLLRNTLMQWRYYSSETRDRWAMDLCELLLFVDERLADLYVLARRIRALQAGFLGDSRRLRWAVEKWKKVSFF